MARCVRRDTGRRDLLRRRRAPQPGEDTSLAARRLRLLQQQLAISAAEAIYQPGQELDTIVIRSFQPIDVSSVAPRQEAAAAAVTSAPAIP